MAKKLEPEIAQLSFQVASPHMRIVHIYVYGAKPDVGHGSYHPVR